MIGYRSATSYAESVRLSNFRMILRNNRAELYKIFLTFVKCINMKVMVTQDQLEANIEDIISIPFIGSMGLEFEIKQQVPVSLIYAIFNDIVLKFLGSLELRESFPQIYDLAQRSINDVFHISAVYDLNFIYSEDSPRVIFSF